MPDANIVVEGDDVHRTLTITPLANAHGTVTITSAPWTTRTTASRRSCLTVTPADDPPSISPITNRTHRAGRVDRGDRLHDHRSSTASTITP